MATSSGSTLQTPIYVNRTYGFKISLPANYLVEDDPTKTGGWIYFRSPQRVIQRTQVIQTCHGDGHPGICEQQFGPDFDVAFVPTAIDDVDKRNVSTAVINNIVWTRFEEDDLLVSSTALTHYYTKNGRQDFSFIGPSRNTLEALLATFAFVH
jgi:hypothetical protein